MIKELCTYFMVNQLFCIYSGSWLSMKLNLHVCVQLKYNFFTFSVWKLIFPIFFSTIANLGGIVSIFLGCSLISVIEIIYFFTLRMLKFLQFNKVENWFILGADCRFSKKINFSVDINQAFNLHGSVKWVY